MSSSLRRSSSMKISRGILCAMGATPPMTNPVARLTVSASARRAGPPARIVSFSSSTRLAPEAITRTGRSWTVKTSDLAILPTATPRASAACWEVCAERSSSMTRRSRPSASSAAWTRSAGGFTALERQLGNDAKGLDLPHPADQRRHAGGLPDFEALADPLTRAAQGHLVHEGIRDRRRRLVLLAGEIEVLDALGDALVPVAAHEVVVEVAPARAHAADVEGEARLDHGPAGGDVVAQHDGDGGRDVEAREGLAAARAREARLERFLEDGHPLRREEDGEPAVGDLGGQGHVPGPDGGEIDGNVRASVEDGLEGLSQSGGIGARVGDLVVLPLELDGLLAPPHRADDLDVLPSALERLAERHAVPAFHHLRPRDTEPQPEAPARQL